MSNGYWNGNYGAAAVGGYGGVGAWGAGSPAYGYGYSDYSNPYSSGTAGGGGVGQPVNLAQPTSAPSYDYSQPLNTAAAPPEQAATDQGSSAVAQARSSFQAGDYSTALQLAQQALGKMPNDATLHEFLGLVLFAQGNYEQAAAPLYAVLSVGPGWDWTTLIANYSEADTYTRQLRALEAYVKANPKSAPAQFVLAYHYISQGHGEAAIKPLENVVALQPNDTLSPQLLSKLQPAGAPAAAPSAPSQAQPFDASRLTGIWVAQPQGAKITLSIKDDGAFDWALAATGKPPVTIKGKSTVADGVLTLNSDQANLGNIAGNVAWQDDKHFGFRAVGAASNDPGLKFAR
jgi:tetratricopeptide (TPR) repeat protein